MEDPNVETKLPADAKTEPHHKLSPKQRILVCSLLAQGLTPGMVAQTLKDEFDVNVSAKNIYMRYANSRKWKPFIAKLKAKYFSEVLKHPLADKNTRLSILMQGIKAVIQNKSTANSMGTLSSLMKEARAEIEGDASTNPVVHQKIIIVNANNEQSRQASSFISKLTRQPENVSE